MNKAFWYSLHGVSFMFAVIAALIFMLTAYTKAWLIAGWACVAIALGLYKLAKSI